MKADYCVLARSPRRQRTAQQGVDLLGDFAARQSIRHERDRC
jgi:hypothetical protein